MTNQIVTDLSAEGWDAMRIAMTRAVEDGIRRARMPLHESPETGPDNPPSREPSPYAVAVKDKLTAERDFQAGQVKEWREQCESVKSERDAAREELERVVAARLEADRVSQTLYDKAIGERDKLRERAKDIEAERDAEGDKNAQLAETIDNVVHERDTARDELADARAANDTLASERDAAVQELERVVAARLEADRVSQTLYDKAIGERDKAIREREALRGQLTELVDAAKAGRDVAKVAETICDE